MIQDYNKLLTDKIVFITTGARGMGRDIAILFAKQGATILLGGRSEEQLLVTMEEIKSIAPASKSYVFDLGNKMQTENVCDKIIKDCEYVDIVVNVAGINKHQPVYEIDDADLERIFEVNYNSTIRIARKLVPTMMKRGTGNIVNISSIHSMSTVPNFTLYAGTKGAMNASARAMALDFAKNGIRVNTICPGLIMSDTMLDEINTYEEGKEREEFIEMLNNMQVLEPGNMEDISNTALFLASDMSKYITGQTIVVDGGALIKAH